MKSISFAMPGMFDKILAKAKTVTGRCIAVPRYIEGEIVKLKEKIGKERNVDVRVVKVTPIKVKDIPDDIARKEGFDTKEDSIDFFKGYYKLKDENYVFFTEWKMIETVPMGELK